MLGRFFRRRPGRELVDRLHADIVAAVRRPAFYLVFGVPDSFEGRFELLTLHVAAVCRRLEAIPDPGRLMAQELTESMFAHLDIALREIGVSDVAMSKRMKKLAEAYFGRAAAYAEALRNEAGGDLDDALARNVYGWAQASQASGSGETGVRLLAAYVRALDASLARCDPAALLAGVVAFPEPRIDLDISIDPRSKS